MRRGDGMMAIICDREHLGGAVLRLALFPPTGKISVKLDRQELACEGSRSLSL